MLNKAVGSMDPENVPWSLQREHTASTERTLPSWGAWVRWQVFLHAPNWASGWRMQKQRQERFISTQQLPVVSSIKRWTYSPCDKCFSHQEGRPETATGAPNPHWWKWYYGGLLGAVWPGFGSTYECLSKQSPWGKASRRGSLAWQWPEDLGRHRRLQRLRDLHTLFPHDDSLSGF